MPVILSSRSLHCRSLDTFHEFQTFSPGSPGPHLLSCPGVLITVTYTVSVSACFPFLGTTVCPPCDNELKSEAIIEHLCASEFGKLEFQPHSGLLDSPPFPVLCFPQKVELTGTSCLSFTSSVSTFSYSLSGKRKSRESRA